MELSNGLDSDQDQHLKRKELKEEISHEILVFIAYASREGIGESSNAQNPELPKLQSLNLRYAH